MGITVALALAATGAAGLPAQIVIVPLAADPVLLKARLQRPVIVWAFAAPARSPDLRHLVAKVAPVLVAAASTEAPRLEIESDLVTTADTELRLASLVADDPQARITGRRLRHSSMAAGLSFKVVQADGILSPLLGMSGPVGKALTRMAVEATVSR